MEGVVEMDDPKKGGGEICAFFVISNFRTQ